MLTDLTRAELHYLERLLYSKERELVAFGQRRHARASSNLRRKLRRRLDNHARLCAAESKGSTLAVAA